MFNKLLPAICASAIALAPFGAIAQTKQYKDADCRIVQQRTQLTVWLRNGETAPRWLTRGDIIYITGNHQGEGMEVETVNKGTGWIKKNTPLETCGGAG